MRLSLTRDCLFSHINIRNSPLRSVEPHSDLRLPGLLVNADPARTAESFDD